MPGDRIRRRQPQGDDGQLLLLIMIFTAIGILLLIVAMDASTYFVAQRNLTSEVDGIAVAAAQQLDAGVFYDRGGDSTLPIDQAKVDAVAAAYAGRDPTLVSPAGGCCRIVVVDGRSGVRATFGRDVRFPMAGLLGIDSKRVWYTAYARSPLR